MPEPYLNLKTYLRILKLSFNFNLKLILKLIFLSDLPFNLNFKLCGNSRNQNKLINEFFCAKYF